MLAIRMSRHGTKKRPFFHIVVADSRSPRDGRFIETIGFYDPLHDPAIVRLDADKARTWMRNGARPSEAARELLVREGVLAARPRPTRGAKAEPDTPATTEPAAAPVAVDAAGLEESASPAQDASEAAAAEAEEQA